MICPHCGHDSGTIKDEVLSLAGEGMTPTQIRDEMVRRGRFKNYKHRPLAAIYNYLRLGGLYHPQKRGLQPHLNKRKV